jgi:hypothetical protein
MMNTTAAQTITVGTEVRYADNTRFLVGRIIKLDASAATIRWNDGIVDTWTVAEFGPAGCLRVV